MVVSNTTVGDLGLIEEIHSAFENNTNFPTYGSSTANKYLNVANRLLRQKSDGTIEPTIRYWRDQWTQNNSGGTIAVGTQTYNLVSGLLELGGFVTVTKVDGGTVKYQVVDPKDLPRYTTDRVVYETGNPTSTRKITFTLEITADDPIVGGTISYPYYASLPVLNASSDVVPLARPDWLVYAVCAEMASLNPAKEDYADRFANFANQAMVAMRLANESLPYHQSDTVPVYLPETLGEQ